MLYNARLLVKMGYYSKPDQSKLITPMMNSLPAIATLNHADASTKPLPIPEQQPLLQSLRGVFYLSRRTSSPAAPRDPWCNLRAGEGGHYSKYRRNSAPTAASRNTTSSVRRRARLYTLHTRGVTSVVRGTSSACNTFHGQKGLRLPSVV